MFGVPLQVPNPSLLLHTDTSLSGWGGPPSGSDGFGRVVLRGESLHISMLEMRAVVLALATFLRQLSGQSVVLMSDNATVAAYLRSGGGTVSRVLCRMAAGVVLWTECHSVSLTTRYILEKNNVRADQLSRPNQGLPMEWFLLPRVFEGICGVFGHPRLGLFATCANAKLPLYISPVLDPKASLGPSLGLCLPYVCSAQPGLVESVSFDRALIGSGGAVVATERVVHRSFVPVG